MNNITMTAPKTPMPESNMPFPYNYVESEHQGRLLLGDPQ